MDCETKLNSPAFYYSNGDGTGSNILDRFLYPLEILDSTIHELQKRYCLSSIYNKINNAKRTDKDSLNEVLKTRRNRPENPEPLTDFLCELPFAACLLVAYVNSKLLKEGLKYRAELTNVLKDISATNVYKKVTTIYNSALGYLDEDAKKKLQGDYGRCKYHAALSLVDAN
jgi:hypothetical protein